MANKIQMVRADLDDRQRSLLLSAFPPRYPNVYCRQLVWAYGVPEDFEFPKEPVTFHIFAHHIGEGHEALVGAVYDADDIGRSFQANNGRRLHITLSAADGVPPARGGEIDVNAVREFPAIKLTLHLKIGHAVRLVAERQ